jgi:LPS-assembly protein
MSGDYRYLGSAYQGDAQAAILPHDNQTGEQRYALALHHNQSLGGGWAGGLNIQSVSDDNYFRDLTNNLSNTAQNNLPREGVLAWHGNGMAFLGRVQKFQTLQDPLTPITPPYSRAPQLLLNGAWDTLPVVSAGLSSEWVDFRHSTMVSGQRLTLYPSVSIPLSRSHGYVTPKLGVHHTNYSMTANNTGDLPDSVRTLPIFSVDSGLFFERPLQFGNLNLLQTLEPRLYYLNIPYRDQSQLPLFDTALADLNYSMMFSENQFIGGDRINDANQITLAVTTRLIDTDNGQEGIRATIGQRFYFEDQQVLLDYSGAQADTASDILASVGARVAAWAVDATTQYQPNQSDFARTGVSVSYLPTAGKALNMGYRFNRDELNPIKQIDVSAQWPLARGWQALGRWNHSLRDDKVLEGLLGLEYNAGCWAARVVAHRFVTTAVESNDSIYFQLELSGLGRLGTNPLDILKRNIYGYSSLNQTNAATYDQH